MSERISFDWDWHPQMAPASPHALIAWGAVARRLHVRLRMLDADLLARLSATASAELLIVAGATADLPWIDGGAYAAPCDEAPGLWLPTLQRPTAPLDLLAAALAARHQRQPLLLWPEPAAVVPLDRLLPLSPALLERIGAGWRGRPA